MCQIGTKRKKREEGGNRGREREKKDITGTCNYDCSIFQKKKEIIQNRKFQGNLDLHVRPPLVSDHLQ